MCAWSGNPAGHGQRGFRDKIAIWEKKRKKKIQRWPCRMHTHINTHTQLASVCIVQQQERNLWSARDRDIKSLALLKTTGAIPFVPCITSSFIPSTNVTHRLRGTYFSPIHSKIQKICLFLFHFPSIKDPKWLAFPLPLIWHVMFLFPSLLKRDLRQLLPTTDADIS